jgi:lipoprotein-releasing system permease protein
LNFPFFIAKRYLFSKKSHNVINVISAISAVGIGVGTIALIVVLSAFNGLEGLVDKLYSSFDPDIKMVAKKGKTFVADQKIREQIKSINGVKYVTYALEETVYVQYKAHEAIATVKGVEEDFVYMTGIDSMMAEGEFVLRSGENNFAVLGYGLAYNLSVFINGFPEPLKMYSAKRGYSGPLNPEETFNKKLIMPSGIFTINQDFDTKYILVPLRFAMELFEYENSISSIEIGVEKGVNVNQIKKQVIEIAGENFEVKTRYELNELIFKTNKTEKWITFMILSFILVIAAFNLIGSLTMLIIEKKQDIKILAGMGADKSLIKKIFITEGLMISLIGGLGGLLTGALLCLVQKYFGIVRLQGIIIEYYPVELKATDFLAVLAIVILIGWTASYFPVKYATKKYLL